MADKNISVCTTCQGKKVIVGVCECNMEWRGTQEGDDWQDCLCTPEIECATCNGEGNIISVN